jgi:hypothetical protein
MGEMALELVTVSHATAILLERAEYRQAAVNVSFIYVQAGIRGLLSSHDIV